jgi:hypothetical protein
MSDLRTRIILAVEVNNAMGLRQPFLFRSYQVRAESIETMQLRKPQSEGDGVKIKEVLNATAAAPGFFKGVIINKTKYRDGTVWNANPANELRVEVEGVHSDTIHPIRLLMSVGCGVKKPSRFRAYQRFQRLDEILVDATVSSRLHSAYQRFDGPSNLFDLEINEWRSDGVGEETFKRINDSTKKFCDSRHNEIVECARELVKCRQMRAKTPRWEKFALGIEYVCRKRECSSLGKIETRSAFIFHLLQVHNESPPDDKNWGRIQQILLESQTTVIE